MAVEFQTCEQKDDGALFNCLSRTQFLFHTNIGRKSYETSDFRGAGFRFQSKNVDFGAKDSKKCTTERWCGLCLPISVQLQGIQRSQEDEVFLVAGGW